MFILHVVFASLALAITASLIIIAPKFSQTFESFGADLPALTLFVLSSYPFFWPVSLFVGLGCILVVLIKPAQQAFAVVVGIANVGLSVVIFILAMVALYLPVFQLGKGV